CRFQQFRCAQRARGRNQPTRGSVWPMKEPPTDLVTAELVQTLQVYWRLEVSQLDYLAVGFGAHHWQATTPTGARYFLALHELGHAGRSADTLTAARAQLQ